MAESSPIREMAHVTRKQPVDLDGPQRINVATFLALPSSPHQETV